jgi:hypothetical protein
LTRQLLQRIGTCNKGGIMAAPTSHDIELLTEHFGYPPVVSVCFFFGF